MRYPILLIAALVFICSCNGGGSGTTTQQQDAPTEVPFATYNVIKVYPHDTSSYTEGLVLLNNVLYESTGNRGKSKLRQLQLETGKAVKDVNLAANYFGEGIAILNNKIYQLTYEEHKVFVYDAATFKKTAEFTWPFEGWGMTHNGKDLIIGTGSSNLYFVNPETFKIISTISVTDNYGPVGNINELEYVNGAIYANVYLTDDILKIDPVTGKVLLKLDMKGLLEKSGMVFNPAKYDNNTGNVLNGIAYDSAKNTLLVTGKFWPALFEIQLN